MAQYPRTPAVIPSSLPPPSRRDQVGSRAGILSNPDMLIAFGSGLLSGDDWASGFAQAGQNMLGVRQYQRQDEQAAAQAERQRQQDELEYQQWVAEQQAAARRQASLEKHREATLGMQDRRLEQAEKRMYQRKDVSPTPVGNIVLPDGTMHYGYFDKNIGKLMYETEGGPQMAPPGSREVTSGMGGPPPTPYFNIRRELMQTELALGKLLDYAHTTENMNQGIQLWADQISANVKTLFDTGQLNPQELAAQVADGQLQGLLGLFREDVVGGGVMTEFDAQRVLNYLGGDVGALRNPERVRAALEFVIRDKLARYDLLKEMHKTWEMHPLVQPYRAKTFELPWRARGEPSASERAMGTAVEAAREQGLLTPEEEALVNKYLGK